jgi:acetyl-CoA synthetase
MSAKGGNQVYEPVEEFRQRAHIKSLEEYQTMYERSVNDPEAFWGEIAQEFTWFKQWDKVRDFDFHKAEITFFEGGKTNIAFNCLDRHLDSKGDQVAIIWEGNDPSEEQRLTYKELHTEVCRFANVLRKAGVKKGDRVCTYLQMVPHLPITLLACARIGAAHSVVFGAFSADSLRDRINDSECKVLVTQDTALRGKKTDIPMKTNADKALEECPTIEHVFVVKRSGHEVPMKEGRDQWWEAEMAAEDVQGESPYEEVDAEDPLFILGLCGHHVQAHLRLSRRGCVLVHG